MAGGRVEDDDLELTSERQTPSPSSPIIEDPSEPELASVPDRSRWHTAVFAVVTMLSRITGLAREVVAARYFGVSGSMSAFTVAFQVPNLMRALFSDSALQGAFIPVFTDLLQQDRRREAARAAWNLAFMILTVLGLLSALFVITAPTVLSLLTPGFRHDPTLRALTTGLSRIMFPTIIFFSLSGLVAGVLNCLDHFAMPVIAQVTWNLVIIASLFVLVPLLPHGQQIYAYAIGVAIASVVMFLMPLPWLKGTIGRPEPVIRWRDPAVRRVLRLMVPVSLTLGLFNFSLLIDSLVATLVTPDGPAAVDRAFRLVVLPQGVFTVAISTVLFPTLARLAARNAIAPLREATARGVRQICLFTLPSGTILAVLATPITRLIYQHGAFNAHATRLVSSALVIWALSLPFQGVSTFLSQTFFSMRRPWVTTALAAAYLVVNGAVALALYRPFGLRGVVLATVLANVLLTAAKFAFLRRPLEGVDGPRTFGVTLRMTAASGIMAAALYPTWKALESSLGVSIGAELLAVSCGIGAGLVVYALVLMALRVPELDDLRVRAFARLGARR